MPVRGGNAQRDVGGESHVLYRFRRHFVFRVRRDVHRCGNIAEKRRVAREHEGALREGDFVVQFVQFHRRIEFHGNDVFLPFPFEEGVSPFHGGFGFFAVHADFEFFAPFRNAQTEDEFPFAPDFDLYGSRTIKVGGNFPFDLLFTRAGGKGRRIIEVDIRAFFVLQHGKQPRNGGPRAADAGAAAVRTIVLHAHIAAHAPPSAVHGQRAVTVERIGLVFVEHVFARPPCVRLRSFHRLVARIHRAGEGVEGGAFDAVGIAALSGEQQQAVIELHPRYGNAGFLHVGVHALRLPQRGMVEHLVRTAGAADDRDVRVVDQIAEFHNGV